MMSWIWSMVMRVRPKLRISMSVELGGQSMLHSPRAFSGTMGSFGKSAGAPSSRLISVVVA
jgi:hypothetical protein